MKVNTPAGWTDCTPTKINTPNGWQTVKTVKMSVDGVWNDVFPPASIPPYLYDVNIVYKGNHVVDFTALSGYIHTQPDEEAYLFRCTELSSLNGYVSKNFTKTFPVSTAYPRFNCTLQDVSGDMAAVDAKSISFTVDNK